MAESTWTHATEVSGAGKRESWHSAGDEVSAFRRPGWIEYRDHRQDVYHTYDTRDELLYRLPNCAPRRASHFHLMSESLTSIFLAPPQDNPLERLEFLGRLREEMELIDHSTKQIEDDGEQWLEFWLKVRRRNSIDEMEWCFRADPHTRQLRRLRIDSTHDGKAYRRETEFEYPETGPSDIYDLGVPRSANIVDRVPSNRLQQILDTLRADRQRMDNYRVLVVTTRPDSQAWWYNDRPKVMYRKGNKFRVDSASWIGDYPTCDQPAEGADMEAWWKQRAAQFTYVPFYISDESLVHLLNVQPATGEDGATRLVVEKVETHPEHGTPGNIFPPYWSRLPDFACRHPMGIPRQDCEPVLIETPQDGPAGTILLEVRLSSRESSCAGDECNDRPQPNVHRYWLDPQRDFAALRSDMVKVQEGAEDTLIRSESIEEVSRAPNGTWYASRLRQKAIPPVSFDEVVYFYVDFDVELPDSLFEVPHVGQRLA